MANNKVQSYSFLEQGPWIGAAMLWHHQCADCLIWDIWDIWSASPAVHWKRNLRVLVVYTLFHDESGQLGGLVWAR